MFKQAAKLFGLSVFVLASFPIMAVGENKLEGQADGVILRMPDYLVRVEVLSDTIVRIAASNDHAFSAPSSIDIVPRSPIAEGWRAANTPTGVRISTARLQVQVNATTGAVTFLDSGGKEIVSEVPGSRKLAAASVDGENTFHVAQRWNSKPDECLYGLGQQQLGILNIKGYDLDLWQHNTNVVVPFLVSSNGYGILWDNTSYTRFGNLRTFEPVPSGNLLNAQGQVGGLTVEPQDGSEPSRTTADLAFNFPWNGGGPRPKNMRWQGYLQAPVSGEYQFQTYSNGGLKVWIDQKLVIDHWRQGWLAGNDQVKIPFEGGHRYPIKIETDSEQQSILQFLWKTPAASEDTALWSEVGDGEDYTLFMVQNSIGLWPVIGSLREKQPCYRHGFLVCGNRDRDTRRPSKVWMSSTNSGDARYRSTISCRTGNTGDPTPGARMSLTSRAFLILRAGSARFTSGTRIS